MKVEHVLDNYRYTLSNDNLKVNDEVFPIAFGRCLDNGDWILHKFEWGEHSGFPNSPHIIQDLSHSNYKPYQVRTDHGYGPCEKYFKIIKKERVENHIISHNV